MRSKAETYMTHIFKNISHMYIRFRSIVNLSLISSFSFSFSFVPHHLETSASHRMKTIFQITNTYNIICIYTYIYYCSTLCESKTHGRGNGLRSHPRSERSSEYDDGVYVRVYLNIDT